MKQLFQLPNNRKLIRRQYIHQLSETIKNYMYEVFYEIRRILLKC